MICSIRYAGQKVRLGVSLFAGLFLIATAGAVPSIRNLSASGRDARIQSRQTDDPGNTLTVIDTSLHDWKILKDAIRDSPVLVFRPDRDPLEQMNAALSGRNDVRTVNIFSHGTPGLLHFSDMTVSLASLDQNSEQWRLFGSHLAPSADLMLYGCDIAQGEAGRVFVDKLAQVTGADVAASSNATGEPRFGGDWELEVQRGSIESHPLRIQAYLGLLTVVH